VLAPSTPEWRSVGKAEAIPPGPPNISTMKDFLYEDSFCYYCTMKILKKTLLVLGYILGTYLILRAAVEPFIIDYHDPESYKELWGGPTLMGVLAVHMLPGIISLALIAWHQRKIRSQI